MKPRPSPSPFLLLCGVGLLAIFSSTMSKSPVLPLFAKELGATDATLGFIAAASTVVGILVSLPAGLLSDRFGRRRVILAAMFVFASAPFLYLFVRTPWQLVLVRIYHGFATAIYGPVAMALVADLFAARRGEKMGWYSSATLAGRSLAPFTGGFLLLLSAQAVYVGCAVGGMLALLLAWQLPEERGRVGERESGRKGEGKEIANCNLSASSLTTSPPHHDPTSPLTTHHSPLTPPRSIRGEWAAMRESLRFVLGHRAILATSLVEALQYLAYGAVETFLPVYAAERCGLSEWQIGVLLGAKVVTITLTKPLSGRTSDEVGRRPSIAAGLLVSAVTLSLLPAFRSFWPLLLMATGFGLGVSIVTASTSAFVADLSRAGQHGASLGILSTIMDLGHSTGPMLAGLLIAALGYGRSYLSLAVLVAGGAVLFLLTAPGEPGTENQAAKPGERGS